MEVLMDKRTVLAVVLSLAILMGYQFYVSKTQPPRTTEVVNQETVTETVKGDESPAKIETGDVPLYQKSLGEKGESKGEGKDIIIETPLYSASFSTRGAALKSFALKNYRQNIKKDSALIELVKVREGMDYPLTVSFPGSSIDIPTDIVYETDRESVDMTMQAEAERLVFSWSYPGEIEIEKIYTFRPDKYIFELEVQVRNLSDHALRENALLTWNRYIDPEGETDRYSHEGPAAYIKEDFITEKVKKLGEKKVLGPDVSWGGFESKYFLAAMIPEQPSLTSMIVSKDTRELVATSLEGPKLVIPSNQSGIFRYILYLGPKDYDLLKAENVGLENAIDYGSWIKWLSIPLMTVLKFIYQYVHNYGIAIIILTTLVKILFWPLGNISYKSMKEMQKLQPQMMKLREKYPDDKARLQQETMALYKAHKVNPMGGCFPMLIQIPVFFGLYRALLYSIELRHSEFFFWIQDLSAKDPYYITPIIMGATMFLQQKMSPTPGGNEMQAKMMMWMPVVFTFLFLNFPSGLVIYWLFNNILSIGQQYYINKRV
jgi:YidC/Oxa1 family membrane protein insertase